jgi:hypothetical protein
MNIFRSALFITTYVQIIVIGQHFTRTQYLRHLSNPGGLLYYANRNFILCALATLGVAWE